MQPMGCTSATRFGSTEIEGMNPENLNFDLAARRPLDLTLSLPGCLLAGLHPGHLVGLRSAINGTLLPLRLVYSGVSAICLVAPFATVLIAMTLFYLRATRRNIQREHHRLIWLRIVRAIGHDSRLLVAR